MIRVQHKLAVTSWQTGTEELPGGAHTGTKSTSSQQTYNSSSCLSVFFKLFIFLQVEITKKKKKELLHLFSLNNILSPAVKTILLNSHTISMPWEIQEQAAILTQHEKNQVP